MECSHSLTTYLRRISPMEDLMKKIVTALLMMALVFSFAGCGSKDTGKESETSTAAQIETRPEMTQTLEEIVELIYTEHPVEFSVTTIPVDLADPDSYTTYTGLTDVSNIEEAVVSEAMIGAIPYSLALVRVKDGTDTEALAKEMAGGINQRKWICVEADDLSMAASGNLVMLVMVGSDYSETATSEEMVTAFETVCGSLDVKLIHP